MPDLIRGPTQESAPSQYTLAPRQAIIPESITATFDGTGAAGAFLPTLSIYAQSGELLARCPASSVAAGSSAEVTFAPLLRAATAAGAGATFCSFAVVSNTGSLANGGAFFTVPTLANFDTNDSATFAQDSSGGAPHVGGILITAAGRYFAWGFARFLDPAGGAAEPITSWMFCRVASFNYNGSQSDWHLDRSSQQGMMVDTALTVFAWEPWHTDQQDVGAAFVGPPYSEYHVSLYNAGTQTMNYQIALYVLRVGDSSGL